MTSWRSATLSAYARDTWAGPATPVSNDRDPVEPHGLDWRDLAHAHWSVEFVRGCRACEAQRAGAA